MTKTTYDESSIKSLAFPESVRKKPTLYIGPIDERGILTILREICDNTVDEALNGKNTLCSVTIAADGSYTVVDEGRGVPVGMISVEDSVNQKTHKVSALKAVFSILNTGGKFHDKAYATSRGTHGIGSKATNALSDKFEVWTKPEKDKSWYVIRFAKGLLIQDVTKTSAPKYNGKTLTAGTMIKFKPDAKCFTNTKLPVADFLSWCQITAYLTPNLKIEVINPKGAKKTFHEKDGPKDFVKREIAEKKCSLLGKPFIHINSSLVDCVIAFTDYDGQSLKGYTNGLFNAEGGVHVNATAAAIHTAIQPYKKKTHTFTLNELKEGLVGLVNVKISSPQFDSQTKEKLVDERASGPVKTELTAALKTFFAANKTLAVTLCDRATQLKDLKGKFVASKKVLRELKNIQRSGFPSKFSSSSKAPPDKRELYLVEGESAGGCITNSTPVLLSNGRKISFKELVDDFEDWGTISYGKAYDEKTNTFVNVPLRDPRLTKHVTELVVIDIGNGSPIRCTTDHPILTTRGWVKAEDLKPDDSIVSF